MAVISDNMSESLALANLDESFIMSVYLLSNDGDDCLENVAQWGNNWPSGRAVRGSETHAKHLGPILEMNVARQR